MLDIVEREIVGKYIKDTYRDPQAEEKLSFYLNGYSRAWKDAMIVAGNHIEGWHSNMDSVHEGVTKGLLSEIEHSVRALEPGDA